MGLDTFAVKPPQSGSSTRGYELAPAELFEGVGSLCGGLFSYCGNGPSFRGKVYDDYIREVTGETLYQEYIPPETVREMARALEEAAKRYDENAEEYGELGVTREEAQSLARWFRVCADNGFAIHNWW